jgi:hypothetical protein
MTTATPLAVTASSDADYERLGLARGDIKPWEDAARTDDRPGTYEWWYFDAHLDDGSTLVVVFMDKNLSTPQRPIAFPQKLLFHETEWNERTITKPSKTALCRGPESNWRHMVLQVMFREGCEFAPEPKHDDTWL